MAKSRFSAGAYEPKDCAANRLGYAAILPTLSSSDPHCLSQYALFSSAPSNISSEKSYFIMARYFCTCLLLHFTECFQQSFIVFSPLPFFPTLRSIATSVSQRGAMVMCVITRDNLNQVESIVNGNSFLLHIMSREELFDLCLKLLGIYLNSIAPDCCIIDKDVIDVMSSIGSDSWYIPLSNSSIYVPSSGKFSHSHYAFPWSRSTTCAGFNIGYGYPRKANEVELNLYLGTFNFHER